MKNLKRLLVALVALTVCFCADAGLRFGVKAGVNVDHLSFNKKLLDADNRMGFTGGVMLEYMIPVFPLGFDLFLMYTRMNAREEICESSDEGSKIELGPGKNFIELPLNVKYKFSFPIIESIVKPYVYTGPSFALKLDKNTSEYWKTKTCQVAWNVGIGFEFVKHLQLQASYGFGINNVVKHVSDLNADGNIKLRNNYWTVTLGWMF